MKAITLHNAQPFSTRPTTSLRLPGIVRSHNEP